MQIRLVKMAGAYSKHFNFSLFWYYIKQIMNVFIRAMVRIFSFGERWNVPFNSAVASLNGTFYLSPHENILTIALINIHYLYNVPLFLSSGRFSIATRCPLSQYPPVVPNPKIARHESNLNLCIIPVKDCEIYLRALGKYVLCSRHYIVRIASVYR